MGSDDLGGPTVGLFDTPAATAPPIARLLLAHGAGAPVTSPFMERMTELLAARNMAVTRFEFAYMAARRRGGKRRPPPKAEHLIAEYLAAVDILATRDGEAAPPLFIGGKSLGGRVASMAASVLFDAGRVTGVVCLGYPFHPPGMPEKIRTSHLTDTAVPMLIVQGERDPFGSRAEVEDYALSPRVEVVFVRDGDHDLGPRGGHGTTRRENMARAADAIAAFVESVNARRNSQNLEP
ncbi:MAG: alpha/beta family hydrolase [Hyphomicrobiaceae bacterium]